jgi:cytoskeletal protein RodZ
VTFFSPPISAKVFSFIFVRRRVAMKHKMKKILPLLVAVLLLAGSLTVPSFADLGSTDGTSSSSAAITETDESSSGDSTAAETDGTSSGDSTATETDGTASGDSTATEPDGTTSDDSTAVDTNENASDDSTAADTNENAPDESTAADTKKMLRTTRRPLKQIKLRTIRRLNQTTQTRKQQLSLLP